MILYKKDTKNNIRYLETKVIGDSLIQISGIVGTENPITHSKVCKGKNIGRSNETTGEQQAVKEENSLIEEKLKEGYFKTKEEAETEETLFPMLAKDYKKEFKKIDWLKSKVFVQPKLDGMRCLVIINDLGVTLKSRDGRFIETMHHLVESLNGVTHGIYDGELYAHGYSFQENMEFIKKYRPESHNVKFHCYDTVVEEEFSTRLLVRDTNLSGIETVEFVKTYKIKSEKELVEYHKQFLDLGYEGSIVRHGEAPYKINGRSSNLLKYKDFQDIAVKIVDITPADQRTEWGVPVLDLGDGRTFRAGTKMSHEQKKEQKSDFLNIQILVYLVFL